MNTVRDDDGLIVIVLTTEGHKPGPADINIAVAAAWDTAMKWGENSVTAIVDIEISVSGSHVRVTLTGWE